MRQRTKSRYLLTGFSAWILGRPSGIVKVSGPGGLRLIQGFHDEALRGEWQGHRSSRLGIQYRVIYRVVAQELHVLVIDLTAHDYRRR
jgi:hypothetical protein